MNQTKTQCYQNLPKLPKLNCFQTGSYYKWIDNWKTKFTKWAAGEPKEKNACVYLDLDGTWRTASCNESYFSVCKISDGKQINVLTNCMIL